VSLEHEKRDRIEGGERRCFKKIVQLGAEKLENPGPGRFSEAGVLFMTLNPEKGEWFERKLGRNPGLRGAVDISTSSRETARTIGRGSLFKRLPPPRIGDRG
jgi:hypothetical protein